MGRRLEYMYIFYKSILYKTFSYTKFYYLIQRKYLRLMKKKFFSRLKMRLVFLPFEIEQVD